MKKAVLQRLRVRSHGMFARYQGKAKDKRQHNLGRNRQSEWIGYNLTISSVSVPWEWYRMVG